MGLTLAIDFGSTYTKVVAFDLANEELVGAAQAPSTVDTDMMISLGNALEGLRVKIGVSQVDVERVVASSSAAGGLRVVAAGLVSVLTSKAAEEAALGAGAKLVGTYCNGLSADDVKEIEQIAPDLILLTGGTDGGNKECIINSADLLAASRIDAPIIIAGNKLAAGEARSLLEDRGKYAITVENVLPEVDVLNVEPARSVIRETFMRWIIRGKGLDKAREYVGDIIMPTPTAVLLGARLLAEGAGDERGIGELIVVDVGGATTDVVSIAHGHPSIMEVVVKGLPEPYMKRTVEGDLGIRYNAVTILEKAGKARIVGSIASIDQSLVGRIDLDAAVQNLSRHIDAVPQSEDDLAIDVGLACTAVDMAVKRHCGRIDEVYSPTGKVYFQHGKDLTKIRSLVGTGGIFAYGNDPRRVLEAGLHDLGSPESLRPAAPDLYVDESYILYAIGLLSESSPVAALRIMKKHLTNV